MSLYFQGVNDLPKSESAVWQMVREYVFLLTRPLYVVAFLVNISGSVLFYMALANKGALAARCRILLLTPPVP